MCCSVRHSWLGDGCKSFDKMTFSLTDDGQEGHYFELLAKLSPAAGVIQVRSDVRVNKFEKPLSFSLKSRGWMEDKRRS